MNTHTAVTFEQPPTTDLPAPTTAEITAALTARPGEWAIVYRADRAARAEAFAERIREGRTYGPGCDALVRKVGAEIRVYARKDA